MEYSVTAFPEWSDQDIAQEKFNLKHIFEDTEKVLLPPSLEKMTVEYKRICDIFKNEPGKDWVIVSNSTLLNENLSPTSRLPGSLEKSDNGYSKFTETNSHLLTYGSTFVKELLQFFHLSFDNDKSSSELLSPYNLLYPKSKDGNPTYSSCGKYIVKLFFMGAWRKIIIDDKIPLDANGKVLLISSSLSNELWPLLINKALFKLAYAFYSKDIYNEILDFNVFQSLTGWAPETFQLSTFKSPKNMIVAKNILKMTTSTLTSQKANVKQQETKDFQIIISAYPNINNTFIVASRLTTWPLRVSLPNETEEPVMDIGDTVIKLTCYFGVDDMDRSLGENILDTTCIYLSKFLSCFHKMVIMHNPAAFKFKSSLMKLNDATKAADIFKGSYLLSN